jgi:hypothetical protein
MIGNVVGPFLVGDTIYVTAGTYAGEYGIVEGPGVQANSATCHSPDWHYQFEVLTANATKQALHPNYMPFPPRPPKGNIH